MIYVKDYRDGDKLTAQLLVVSALKGVTNNGLTYFTLELRDSSGSINAKKWEVTPQDESIFVAGNVIEANFEVIFYKTSLQLKIYSAKLINEDEIDVSKFAKQPPVAYEVLEKKLKGHIDSISEGDIKKVLLHILTKFKSKFLSHPGASSIHHEYQHGLLHHTVSMADHAAYFASYYPNINKDLLLAGTLLHDIGKTIELEGKVVFKYSLQGKLLGHISIINSEIAKAKEELNINSDDIILLQHMILSHHGQLEYGSPVMPEIKEALLLYLIDNIDSKMVIVEKALETTEVGEFTNKIFALDGRAFYKHQ